MEKGEKTPVEIITGKYPNCKKEIEHISGKWKKRTKRMVTKWPKEGTFDREICDQMGGVIANYRTGDKSEKRKRKREQEKRILGWFRSASLEKYVGMSGGRSEEMTPPPYTPQSSGHAEIKEKGVYPIGPVTSAVTVCPVVKIQVQIQGWVEHEESEEQLGIERARLEEEKGKIEKRVTELRREYMEVEELEELLKEKYNQYDEYHSRLIKKAKEIRDTEKKQQTSKICQKPEQVGPKRDGETHKKCKTAGWGNFRWEKLPYNKWEELKKKITKRTDSQDKHKTSLTKGTTSKKQIPQAEYELENNEGEEFSPAEKSEASDNEVCQASNSEAEESDGGEGPAQVGGDLAGRYQNTRERPPTRRNPAAEGYSHNASKPNTIAPLLIKEGGVPRYIPWSTQDMHNVITNLPDLQNGASHWIRVLEEETTGRILAVGDLKALLGKVVGMETMLDIFEQAGFDRNHAQSPAVDGGPFDNVRGVVWTALRALYPARPDMAALTGPPLKDNEPPATYIHMQLRRWRLLTKRDVRADPIMTTLFRKAIQEGMSPEVGRRLDEVVGLNTMTHREFVDHVVHAVDRQRKEGKKLEDQTKDIQRKLLQLQLEELRAKEKKAREITELRAKEKEAEKVASVKIQYMDNEFFNFEATPPPEPWSSRMVPRPTVVYDFSGIPHPVAMQDTKEQYIRGAKGGTQGVQAEAAALISEDGESRGTAGADTSPGSNSTNSAPAGPVRESQTSFPVE
ncbi:uncharacterized protein LOC118234558 isoform X2 [Anguilla anguilla]|uniref:uncharacterized protein LOC118234558 isoform X2 n=1 Tax=Anguilla anguilla TaxID=7936 RepID=UPI0015AE2732|nr:uncharacterized protein LOC118234558 isoform X2 [Anguilla anguilla]